MCWPGRPEPQPIRAGYHDWSDGDSAVESDDRLVRVVADAFGATLGSALIYTCGAVLLLVFRRPAPLRKYPRTYLIVGGLLFVFYESSISLSIGLASRRPRRWRSVW